MITNARTPSGSNAVKLAVDTVKALTSFLAAEADKSESKPTIAQEPVVFTLATEAENWLVEYAKRPAPYKPPVVPVDWNGNCPVAFLAPYKELPEVNGLLSVPYWKSKKNTRPDGKFIG